MGYSTDDVMDPMWLKDECWPTVNFYSKQQEVIYSVVDNETTIVVAGNQLGKDHVAGFIVLWYFLAHGECRIITTSVRDDHLDVLWSEINRYISTSVKALPLHVLSREIRKTTPGKESDISYIKGMVSKKGEGLSGHHAYATMLVGDEASGLDEETFTFSDGWCTGSIFKKRLLFGNPNECNNLFKQAVKGTPGTKDQGGNIKLPGQDHYTRYIIQMKGEDSPNVQYAISRMRDGTAKPDPLLIKTKEQYWGVFNQEEFDILEAKWDTKTEEEKKEDTVVRFSGSILNGPLSWYDYRTRRYTWDPWRQTVGIDAEFYDGPGLFLYPLPWRNASSARASDLKATRRIAECMGIDPAEGGDNTSWAVSDSLGLIELVTIKTPDTFQTVEVTLDLMKRYGLKGPQVIFDRGGGGRELADYMRRMGGICEGIRTIEFNESATPEPKRGITPFNQRKVETEIRSIYKNRRMEMYYALKLRMDPMQNPKGFGVPDQPYVDITVGENGYGELHRQMSVMPLKYDQEGVMYLPPKNKTDPNSSTECLRDVLGRSPDELDAFVISVFGIQHKEFKSRAGGF